MILVIDDFVTPSYSNSILYDCYNKLQYAYSYETSLQTEDYGEQIYKDSNTHDFGQFVCPIFADGKQDEVKFSDYFNELKVMVYTLEDVVPELKIYGIVRIKANLLLQQPNAPEFHYNIPHQDAREGCYSMVYYCNDSDGDTVLFNEFYKQGELPKELTVCERIKPKKNRAVIFNSNRYHASSNPRNTRERFVLNFIFRANEAN